MYDLKIIEERILSLSNGVSKNKLLQCANLNKSVFDNMRKGQIPSVEKIHAIADYLDCSVDYLLGRTDVPEVNHRSGSIMPTAEHGTIAAFGGGVHMAPDDDEPITTLPKSR